MKTPRLDWEALKPLLLNLKYERHLSLTEINTYLHEQYGKHVTNARLSQIFTNWRYQDEALKNEQRSESLNANSDR